MHQTVRNAAWLMRSEAEIGEADRKTVITQETQQETTTSDQPTKSDVPDQSSTNIDNTPATESQETKKDLTPILPAPEPTCSLNEDLVVCDTLERDCGRSFIEYCDIYCKEYACKHSEEPTPPSNVLEGWHATTPIFSEATSSVQSQTRQHALALRSLPQRSNARTAGERAAKAACGIPGHFLTLAAVAMVLIAPLALPVALDRPLQPSALRNY
eukprot:CAMPEP_0181027958 /NCGR_PEP_ID=MMETSP1070-20121207/4426_1 /TAXON_ID=265543 /ORGANISM="Minutocellus polymorphus, Strain NH13" /LENGTH=213 /DNA_ID=CAMNT_0023105203 /DNA_START=335 /DNA_END=978 /DNA_ORIENTATION=+